MMEDRPLETLIRDGGMMNIFRTIGCIGDSLASGEFEYYDNGKKGYWDFYEYSWGKQIERATGISVTNFSRGGMTAYHMYQDADGHTGPNADIAHLFDPFNLKQGYIIALGVNDLKGKNNLNDLYGGQVGSAKTDICLEDYTKNAGSFVGWYAKIIQRLQSMQPDAKFFLMTMPDEACDNWTEPAHAEALHGIAARLKNCYVIDLFHDAPKYDEEFRRNYFCGHMNAMGYLLTAHYVMTYIDWIIRHHVQEFRYVQFIGSDKIPFEKAPRDSFVNGKKEEFVRWYDTDGHIINASDGGMIYVDGMYHWYGMALRRLPNKKNGKGGQTTTKGVVMYASKDLYHWDYEGVILACSTDPESELYGPMRFERPKILRNPKTGKYVLWCHYVKYPGDHGNTPGTAEAGVAVCDTVNGSYQWLGTTRPIDDKGLVRDCTVFQDRDGSGYYIYDRQVGKDRCLHIVKLSDDYLSMTQEYRRLDAAFWREAATLVYRDGWYYMITSDLTSWDFNQAKYFRAKSVMGPWEDMGDPCIGDTDHQTFHSQSTWIFKVEGCDDLYIHMAERHNTANFEDCSYIWLPIDFHEDHTLSLSYQESWKLPEEKNIHQ